MGLAKGDVEVVLSEVDEWQDWYIPRRSWDFFGIVCSIARVNCGPGLS